MKALFLTTKTVDCFNHVRAWNSVFETASHSTFETTGLCNDWQLLEAADAVKPEVIFYIGAQSGSGNPRASTFRDIRKIAPLINLCSDAADTPWHRTLETYHHKECFDLQVSIDGAKHAPVDLATLTPVDPKPFAVIAKRDIRCGFSGSVGRFNPRSEIVNPLVWFSNLTVRAREKSSESYHDHAVFLRRCQMLLNVSATGSGLSHHIKGRVVEAGMAGCALLESAGSPIGEWFPDDCFIRYDGPVEAAEIIKSMPDSDIDHAALRLSEEVRARYMPEHIYGEILESVFGSNVRRTIAVAGR